ESFGHVEWHVRRWHAYHRDSLPCGFKHEGVTALQHSHCSTAWKPSFLSVASPMVSMLDLERFRTTPLTREPFEFLIVPEFVKADARSAIHNDYPPVERPCSFPLGEVTYGSAFAKLVEEMRSDEFRKAFEEKFGIDLTNRPDMITVRGRCSEKDGKIHTDSETKIITILLYMNSA